MKIYYIWVHDPRSTEYAFEGREYIDISKGAFTSKEVAEQIILGMQMFQEKGDPCTFSVRELELHSEETFAEWMATNGPGARRTG
jgi:hypothetical protein